jgi:hypothetical protein
MYTHDKKILSSESYAENARRLPLLYFQQSLCSSRMSYFLVEGRSCDLHCIWHCFSIIERIGEAITEGIRAGNNILIFTGCAVSADCVAVSATTVLLIPVQTIRKDKAGRYGSIAVGRMC